MVETLLILGCAYGNVDSCEYSASAYYSYSGIERVISEKQVELTRQQPALSTIIATGAGMVKGVLLINLGHGRSITLNKEGLLGFKAAF